MSLPLHAHGRPIGLSRPLLGRIVHREPAADQAADSVLLTDSLPDLLATACAAVLTTASPPAQVLDAWSSAGIVGVHSLSRQDQLAPGDVVALQPNGYVRTLYRRSSPHNALFATDRCNSYCLMCSQPPKPVDDSDRIHEHLRLLDLIDPETRELGITGGEPTLLKDDLLRIVERSKQRLPTTALHILSNGRLFYYGAFARALAEIGHPDLMVGVPLYSDLDHVHDHVVQSRGAFAETVIGLQNLGRYGVPVEIRVVLHRWTWQRLPRLAEFLYRNFTFAAHVAFMGLEPIGFAAANLDELWIDPIDYREELGVATRWLAQRGMNVSIYNHPLCLLDPELWPFARRSISDWKNDYLPVCDACPVKEDCCGFFSSSLRRRTSRHVAPPNLAAASNPLL